MQIQNFNTNWFLSSYEYEEFDSPRKFNILQSLNVENRNLLEVNFDKPISGQEYGYGGKEIFTVYLVGRFENLDSQNLNFKDVHVFIGDFRNESKKTLKDLKNVGWAVIYSSVNDAKNHKIIS